MRKLLLIAVAGIVLLSLISPASAWLTGYNYRQGHNISGVAGWGIDQTNFTVNITLNNTTGTSTGTTCYLNNHSLQWGSATTWADIRITDTSDNSYPIWFENTSATSTSVPVWVNITTIPYTGNVTIYIYYGNSGASTANDGPGTFPEFDHFDDGVVNTSSKWTTSGTVISESNSTLNVLPSGSSDVTVSGKVSVAVPMAIKAYVKSIHWLGTTDTERTYTGLYSHFSAAATTPTTRGHYNDYTTSWVDCGSISGWSAGAWHIQEVFHRNATAVTMTVDGGNVVDVPSKTSRATNNFAVGTKTSGNGVYVDWVFLRKWNSSEPTHSTWGAEEYMPIPAAAFSANITTGHAPLTVTFTDSSTNTPTSWAWDVNNDGVTDYTTQNCTHTYSATGSYTVNLTATNAYGSDSEVKANYIQATTPNPTAAFAANDTTVTLPIAWVTFTDSSTGDSITDWYWDFGDTGTSTTQSPAHQYLTAGSFDVKLRVTNATGSDWENKTGYIVVSLPPAPVAAFSANATSGLYPLCCQFTDSSTNSPTAWSWDFGDGGTSTEQNPVHTFTTKGTYSVTLTATNLGGSDAEAKTGYIIAGSKHDRPTAVTTLSPIDTVGYNMIRDAFGNESYNVTGTPNWSAVLWAAKYPFETSMGGYLMILIYAIPWVMMWLMHRTSVLAVVVGFITGAFIISRLPAEYYLPVLGIITIAVIAIIWSMTKER